MDEVLREKKENLLKEKKVDSFNALLKINNDRIEGYNKASENTSEEDLKLLFREFANTSTKCNTELTRKVSTLGGIPADGSVPTGKFFRAWMDLKAALTGEERKVIFESCVHGEERAIERYREVLKDYEEFLDDEESSMINAQLETLQTDYSKIKDMRDSLIIDA
jgi:uncharacterized protein (TIGR02284 family)